LFDKKYYQVSGGRVVLKWKERRRTLCGRLKMQDRREESG
jgi:hypothetical protein